MFEIENGGLNCDTVLALGNFDGLHRGHIKVLQKALDVSKENNLALSVMLFDEHPKKIISGKRPPMLMTQEKRDEILKKMGFKIVKASFNQFKDLSPEEFLLKIYCKLNVRAICCGFNYHYGKNASGNTETLRESCEKLKIKLFVCDEIDFEGEPISSTRIRKKIENGNIKKANEMLGREFSYKLKVVNGDKRGRQLGFPTINQFFPEDFVNIKYGVYASKVKIGDTWYASVTNVGIRPTVETERPRSETCILDFSGDLYGQEIEVFLLSYIREEKKFDSLHELSKTISRDAKTAKDFFENSEKFSFGQKG